jgi:hypothetical protein
LQICSHSAKDCNYTYGDSRYIYRAHYFLGLA